jgi:hypothetical protein
VRIRDPAWLRKPRRAAQPLTGEGTRQFGTDTTGLNPSRPLESFLWEARPLGR